MKRFTNRYCFALIFLLLGIFQVVGQTTIKGNIKDEKGEAVIGANVTVRGSTIGAASDFEGNYTFTTSQNGAVQLSISAIGYKTILKNVTLAGQDLTENFELFFDALGLDQIVVTGTSMSRTQKEVTGSLAQLNAKQIQAVGANSIADVVRLIPGVHAEGGGGEVASNIMVRGMPSGGQYKYTPIEEDGMPVQSTGYLTSSAQDVTFRMDLGIENLEFARGGSATMFGLGSPLGVFNYTSKKSGRDGENVVKISAGQYNLYRVDFNTGGTIGDKWNYNVGGFARYDEGPLVTGANSRGYQLKGNITRQLNNGHIRFYFRTLDDNVQFYLPYPHQKQATGSDAVKPAVGNDGNEITSIYSTQMGNFALNNPSGTIIGRLADGVTAKGNTAMLEFAKLIGGWELKSKTRVARFEHKFDFWSPGSRPQEATAYAKSKSGIYASHAYTYTDNGQPLALATTANGGKTYLVENSITLRNRPLNDYASDIRLTRKILTGKIEHNITVGAFGSVTRQLQDEVSTGVLVELNQKPRLVDLVVTDTAGKKINVTKGGFRQNVAGRTYNTFEANRLAAYVGDEIIVGKLRIDLGARYEVHKGTVTVSETANNTNAAATSEADKTYRALTGKVITRNLFFDDFGAVAGLNYALSPSTNVYGSFTKGFYFPELRTFSNVSTDAKGNFVQAAPTKNETLLQGEAGVKYGSGRLSGTMAVFYNNIKDRLQNDIVLGSDNVLREITTPVGGVTSFGIEISAAYKLFDGFIADANLTLQDHQYDNFKKTTSGPDAKLGTADDIIVDYKGNWVLRQPKQLFNVGLSYDKNGWDLGASVNYEGKRFADDQNVISLPAYSIVNARAGKTISVGDKQSIKFAVNVYNLLDNGGLTEGDPRVADTTVLTNEPFYNARPILPRRVVASVTFKF